MQGGTFWFVPANIGAYSALIAMHCDQSAPAEEAAEAWWNGLAAQDKRQLQRTGFPRAIAGRRCGDFPSGHVAINSEAGSAEICIDEAIAGQDYIDWVNAEFGLAGMDIVIVPVTCTPAPEKVGPPKAWY